MDILYKTSRKAANAAVTPPDNNHKVSHRELNAYLSVIVVPLESNSVEHQGVGESA